MTSTYPCLFDTPDEQKRSPTNGRLLALRQFTPYSCSSSEPPTTQKKTRYISEPWTMLTKNFSDARCSRCSTVSLGSTSSRTSSRAQVGHAPHNTLSTCLNLGIKHIWLKPKQNKQKVLKAKRPSLLVVGVAKERGATRRRRTADGGFGLHAFPICIFIYNAGHYNEQDRCRRSIDM